MSILNVLMLDNCGKILKIGLECCTNLFKISDDYIEHIIVISTNDVIYQKRKNGGQMCQSDVKISFFLNLHI